jgi:osmotically inducible protein OsmC
MERSATAVWTGSVKEGKGALTTASGVLSETQYSFATRFENGKGTNPEELIAAAHSGCFAMALSAQLGTMNLTPQTLKVTAKVTLEKLDAGWTISKVHLDLAARVPDISAEAFQAAAAAAKANCPVSRLLNAEITLNAVLEQAA